MALKLGGRKFVFSNKAPLYRSFFFSMVRIDVYRRERVLVVSTSDARFIWWNGAERAGLFFCLGCFEIYSGLVEILFMSRAVSLMQSKVGNIKFFVYVYIYIYIVSQDIIASTKPTHTQPQTFLISFWFILPSWIQVITSSNGASLALQHFCIVSNILEFQMINLKWRSQGEITI